jgi:hypothetical protein
MAVPTANTAGGVGWIAAVEGNERPCATTGHAPRRGYDAGSGRSARTAARSRATVSAATPLSRRWRHALWVATTTCSAGLTKMNCPKAPIAEKAPLFTPSGKGATAYQW